MDISDKIKTFYLSERLHGNQLVEGMEFSHGMALCVIA